MENKLKEIVKKSIQEFKNTYLKKNCLEIAENRLQPEYYDDMICQNLSQIEKDIENILFVIKQMKKSGCSGKITVTHCYTTYPISYYAIAFQNKGNNSDVSCHFLLSNVDMISTFRNNSKSIFVEMYVYRNIFQELLAYVRKSLQSQCDNLSFKYGDLYCKYLKKIENILLEDAKKNKKNLEDPYFRIVKFVECSQEIVKDYNGTYDCYNQYINVLNDAYYKLNDIAREMVKNGAYPKTYNNPNGPQGLQGVIHFIRHCMTDSYNAIDIDFEPLETYIKEEYKNV